VNPGTQTVRIIHRKPPPPALLEVCIDPGLLHLQALCPFALWTWSRRYVVNTIHMWWRKINWMIDRRRRACGLLN